eukprot:TRINITY_DN65252_c0_g1_i1.p1 TRINITY_DN65252_c0_g1~~TRINITY_DN65252_c0_g1_i1.p1  ORF type:complete len:451 (+),score=65.28 TRINITY_DN65252_c0_g1_i1:70-1353(+)
MARTPPSGSPQGSAAGPERELAAGWFRDVFGFEECERANWPKHRMTAGEYQKAQAKLHKLTTGSGPELRIAGYRVGEWAFASVRELREEAQALFREHPSLRGTVTCDHVLSDAETLHSDPQNCGATFQAASQFNCLEFQSPDQFPEDGIAVYRLDPTQGPACGIACAAAAAFRNYFVDCGGGNIGQTAKHQLNGIDQVLRLLGDDGRMLPVVNGYLLPSKRGGVRLLEKVGRLRPEDVDRLRDCIRVGVHFNAQVTLPQAARAAAEAGHEGREQLVCQVLCSACPIGYPDADGFSCHQELWGKLPQLVLEAAYEATVWAAIIQHCKTPFRDRQPPRVFLTKVGAGVFGNKDSWVIRAIQRALLLARRAGAALEAYVVHFRQIDALYPQHIDPVLNPRGQRGGARDRADPRGDRGGRHGGGDAGSPRR